MYDFLMIVVGYFLILGLFMIFFSILLPIFQRVLRFGVQFAHKCENGKNMQNILFGVGCIFLWCILLIYCFRNKFG